MSTLQSLAKRGPKPWNSTGVDDIYTYIYIDIYTYTYKQACMYACMVRYPH